MKWLVIFTIFLFAGCIKLAEIEVKKLNSEIVEGSINEYELIQIGPYTCVGMDGYNSGGLWCERNNNGF